MAGALAKLSRIRTALESAKSLDDIVSVRDQSVAVVSYAKAIGLSIDNINAAVEIKLLAERKAGAILAAMGLHGGDRGNQHTGGKVAPCDLGKLGITKIQSHRWQKLAAIPDGTFSEFVRETNVARTELTTALIMRHCSALSKPSNGKPLSDGNTLAAALERLHNSMAKVYAAWPEGSRRALAAKLRSYAEEIESTGGLEL